MTGKQKCRILRELRREIAEANDLTYVTEECKFKGECRGTCPKCEAEVRELERQLDRKARAGRAFAAVGLSAAIAAAATACDADDVRAFFRGSEEPDRSGDLVEESAEPLMGDPVIENTEPLSGEDVPDGSQELVIPVSMDPLVGKLEFDPDIIIEPTAGVPLPEDFVTDDAPDGAENGQN